MYVIVGLGNPTDKYKGTRHNIGFEAVDEIASRFGIKVNTARHKALCGTGIIDGEKVVIVKPQTFMNLSGESVRAVCDFYKIDVKEELIVIYDDISLDVGHIRIRGKGSAGGHNGIKNIIAHLGTQDFKRIKIGVGANEGDLIKHVLGKFDKKDRTAVDAAINDAASATVVMIDEDIQVAMNKYN